MLASRPDQENVLALRPGPTKNRALVPKTAGPYPHTPFKVPLNDENGASGLGDKGDDKTAGKANHNGTAARQPFFTPMAGGRRAPLGNKTTNAKARSGHATAAKRAAAAGLDRTASKPVGRWHEPVSDLGPLKVSSTQANADADTDAESDESEVEYAPPPEPDPAYESDVLPDGMLTLSGLHADNLLRGYYGYFHDPSAGNDGADNKTARVSQASDPAAAQKPAEIDWSIGDMPSRRSRHKAETAGPVSATEAGAKMGKTSKTGTGTTGTNTTDTTSTTSSGTSRIPSTLASGKAARALSVLPDGGRGRALTKQAGPAKATAKTAVAAAKPPATISRALALLPSSKRVPTTTAGRVVSSGGLGSVATQNPRGAVVSRNTLGYTRGRSASSAVRARPASSSSVASSVWKGSAGSRIDKTKTAGSGCDPEFLSIFEDGRGGHDGYHGDDGNGDGGGGRGGAGVASFLEDSTDFVLRLDE